MNLMRPSRINPLISAYTQIHGEFDYYKTPIAPVGCKVLVHDRTNELASWDNHGSPGFYINLPFLEQGTDLHLALDTLQKMLCLELDPSAITAPVTSPSLTVLTQKLDAPIAKHTTRSTTPAGRLHPTGTIVRWRIMKAKSPDMTPS
jgi:hypothetical protein